ncbi:hypothetical protein KKF17_03530 [Patescibacteria group bacterium]|nr:hypothetical protein [Patescibacteria group bacterium]
MSLSGIGGGGNQFEFNPNVFPTGDINGWNILFKLLPGKPIATNSEGKMLITNVRLSGVSLTEGVDYVAFNFPDYEGGPIIGNLNMIKVPQPEDLNFVVDYYSPI